MDTAYAAMDLPFRQALSLWTTVVSVSPRGWAVVDGGLKALGMDHGDPQAPGYQVLYCSDEHTTLVPAEPEEVPDRDATTDETGVSSADGGTITEGPPVEGGASRHADGGTDPRASVAPIASTSGLPKLGDRVALRPAHVDPTVAYHEVLHVVRADEVIDTWPVDLRGW
jgi:D-serine deaminase-like pyridoxal phosphate-dependent protein